MAGVATVNAKITITGLNSDEELYDSFETTTVPTVFTHQYTILEIPGTEELLDLGGVTTPHYIWIKAVDYDLYIDPSYDSTFRPGLIVHAGEIAMFKPVGDVYIINTDYDDGNTEQPTYEYIVSGV